MQHSFTLINMHLQMHVLQTMPVVGGAQRSMFNFLKRKGKIASPITPAPLTKKKRLKGPQAKRTRRLKWGRPTTKSTESTQEKIEKLKSKFRLKLPTGALAVKPQNRKQWHGSVSVNS